MIAILAAVLALIVPAHTPQEAVLRFIENRSPADACAQLAPAYEQSLRAQYGPCIAGMKHQPKASRVRVFAVRIRGGKATLQATYTTPGGRFHELYRLERVKTAWLITGSKLLP